MNIVWLVHRVDPHVASNKPNNEETRDTVFETRLRFVRFILVTLCVRTVLHLRVETDEVTQDAKRSQHDEVDRNVALHSTLVLVACSDYDTSDGYREEECETYRAASRRAEKDHELFEELDYVGAFLARLLDFAEYAVVCGRGVCDAVVGWGRGLVVIEKCWRVVVVDRCRVVRWRVSRFY